MSGKDHDLPRELPEHVLRIHELKSRNARFAKLFDEYHSVDREIRRIEQQMTPVADPYVGDLKERRVRLKDELSTMIRDPSL